MYLVLITVYGQLVQLMSNVYLMLFNNVESLFPVSVAIYRIPIVIIYNCLSLSFQLFFRETFMSPPSAVN